MYTLCNGGKKHLFHRPSIWQGKGFPAGVPPGSSAEHQCTGSIINAPVPSSMHRFQHQCTGSSINAPVPSFMSTAQDVPHASAMSELPSAF
jgi:hypothetical protein